MNPACRLDLDVMQIKSKSFMCISLSQSSNGSACLQSHYCLCQADTKTLLGLQFAGHIAQRGMPQPPLYSTQAARVWSAVSVVVVHHLHSFVTCTRVPVLWTDCGRHQPNSAQKAAQTYPTCWPSKFYVYHDGMPRNGTDQAVRSSPRGPQTLASVSACSSFRIYSLFSKRTPDQHLSPCR